MASVLDIKIAKALLFILFLTYNVMKQVQFAEIEALWLSRIETWGMHFMSDFLVHVFSIFSVVAGQIADMSSLLILQTEDS